MLMLDVGTCSVGLLERRTLLLPRVVYPRSDVPPSYEDSLMVDVLVLVLLLDRVLVVKNDVDAIVEIRGWGADVPDRSMRNKTKNARHG